MSVRRRALSSVVRRALLTMLPRPIRDRVQPPACALQPCGRTVHRPVRVLEQLVVVVQLVANLNGQVVLPVDAVRQQCEALVLVWV